MLFLTQFEEIRASIFRMFVNRKSITRLVLSLILSELSGKTSRKINCNKRIYFLVNFTSPANQNVICHVDFQLAQQRFRTGAGGKPSTWFPPGGLVEHSRPQKIDISPNFII